MTVTDDLLSEIDLGGWAAHYASRPYGHYKQEVYPLFIEALHRRGAQRVLDIGAGPGHLAVEYFKAYPDAATAFVLLDASEELLDIAGDRLSGRDVTLRHASFNRDEWSAGIGKVDAIVSNNALFHVKPEHLAGFYAACAELLAPGGIVLVQMSFGWEDRVCPYDDDGFAAAAKGLLGDAMPQRPRLSDAEEERLAREDAAAKEAHAAAKSSADSAQLEVASRESGYRFLSADTHLVALRDAGLAAGCVWRKLEFAMLLAIEPG